MGTLENLAHRGYTEGFLRRHNHSEYQNYDYGYSVSDTQQFVGEITGRNGDMVEVEVKNKFLVGNSLELMTPQGNLSFNLEQMQNRKGELIDTAPGNGHVVYVPVPKEVDVDYGILLRNLGERQDTRQPHSPPEMALLITDKCINCDMCDPECPNQAISLGERSTRSTPVAAPSASVTTRSRPASASAPSTASSGIPLTWRPKIS